MDWDKGCRPVCRQALEEIIEAQMAAAVERYLQQLEADAAPIRIQEYADKFMLSRRR